MTMHIVKYLGGVIVKLVDFSPLVYFTVCLTAMCVSALNSSYRRLLLYCKAVGFYTVSIQWPIFGSILPISLQQIASEKIYTLHSNELAERYTLISVIIFIDKYEGGDNFKLFVFFLFSQNIDHFLKLNNQLSPVVQQHFKNDLTQL